LDDNRRRRRLLSPSTWWVAARVAEVLRWGRRYTASSYENADLCACAPKPTPPHKAISLVVLASAGALQYLRMELTCLRLRASFRWTFGNALYAAGSYKGLANVKWTCNSPCVSRNYLIQVLLPAPPMQPPMRRGRSTCKILMPVMHAWTIRSWCHGGGAAILCVCAMQMRLCPSARMYRPHRLAASEHAWCGCGAAKLCQLRRGLLCPETIGVFPGCCSHALCSSSGLYTLAHTLLFDTLFAISRDLVLQHALTGSCMVSVPELNLSSGYALGHPAVPKTGPTRAHGLAEPPSC